MLSADPAVVVLRGCEPCDAQHLLDGLHRPSAVVVDVAESCPGCRDERVREVREWCTRTGWPFPSVTTGACRDAAADRWVRLTGLDPAWLRWCPEATVALLASWHLPEPERVDRVAEDLGWHNVAWAPRSSVPDLGVLVEAAHRAQWGPRPAGGPRLAGTTREAPVPTAVTRPDAYRLMLRVRAWSWLAASVGLPRQMTVRDVDECLHGLGEPLLERPGGLGGP